MSESFDSPPLQETPIEPTPPEDISPDVLETQNDDRVAYTQTLEKLYTAFPQERGHSVEIPPTQNIKPQKESPSFGKSVRGITAAVTLALAGMGFSGASYAAEGVSTDQPVKVSMKETAQKHKEIAPTAELESQVKMHVKKLGIFAKMDLIDDIKAHADDIHEILASGNFSGAKAQELLASSGKNLKPILQIYLNGLERLKQGDKENYHAVATKLEELVTKVQTQSLSQLKQEFS
jgi:hypothetical protein